MNQHDRERIVRPYVREYGPPTAALLVHIAILVFAFSQNRLPIPLTSFVGALIWKMVEKEHKLAKGRLSASSLEGTRPRI